MPKKLCVAFHGLNEIVVTNTWSHGATLHINGQLVDTDSSTFSRGRTALLRGSIDNRDGAPSIVEVFGKSGVFRVKLKICVDGVRIGGDDF